MKDERRFIVVGTSPQSVFVCRPIDKPGTKNYLLTEEEAIRRVEGGPEGVYSIFEVQPRTIEIRKAIV